MHSWTILPSNDTTARPARYQEYRNRLFCLLADVPGCIAVGDMEDETRRSFHDALTAYFAAMREIGELIPEPSSPVEYVEAAA